MIDPNEGPEAVVFIENIKEIALELPSSESILFLMSGIKEGIDFLETVKRSMDYIGNLEVSNQIFESIACLVSFLNAINETRKETHSEYIAWEQSIAEHQITMDQLKNARDDVIGKDDNEEED